MIHSDYVYSRGYRGKIKRVVLVFIFGFFSFSSFSVASSEIQKNLRVRDIILVCSNSAEKYTANIASLAKFKALALKEEAECAIIEGRVSEAKQKLRSAINTFPEDFASMYLLLQVIFEESILKDKDAPTIDMELFAKLVNRIKQDWPKSVHGTDPYHYIQEVGNILTPYTLTLAYDYFEHMPKANGEYKEILGQLVRIIGEEDDCAEVMKKVRDKVSHYKTITESEDSKAISDKAYKDYASQSVVIEELICRKKISDMRSHLNL